MNNMDKRKFIGIYSKLSEKKINRQEATADVEAIFKVIGEALAEGEVVKFLHVGSFSILERQPRTISNPATRERMRIYPKKTVKFNAGKKIMEKLK